MIDIVFIFGVYILVVSLIYFTLLKKLRHKVIITVIIALAVLLLMGMGTYRIFKSRTFQFFGHLEYQGVTEEKQVALTFDDGPFGEEVYEVLDTLETHDVTGTFFLNGQDIEANQEGTLAIIDAGHELGNHSYSHKRMIFMSFNEIRDEMETTDDLMRSLGYEPTGYVRSPYCKKLFAFPIYLVQSDQINVTWTVEPETYYKSVDDMVQYTLDTIEPGGIILLHTLASKRSESREALEGIIIGLIDEGYSFVTVSELLDK